MKPRTRTFVASLGVVAAFACQIGEVSAQAVKDGLVGYWPLDKAQVDGKKVKPAVGKSEGTIMGDPQLVKGAIKEALSFNGKTDYVVIGPVTDGLDVTYSLWFNVPKLPAQSLVIFWDDNSNGGGDSWFQIQPDGKIQTQRAGDGFGVMDSVSAVKPNEWTQLTFVADSKKDEKIIYLNGKEDAKAAGKIATRTGTSHIVLAVGHDGANFIKPWYFEGLLDEVMVYNRVLTADEVKKNVAQALAVEPAEKAVLSWGLLKSQIARD